MITITRWVLAHKRFVTVFWVTITVARDEGALDAARPVAVENGIDLTAQLPARSLGMLGDATRLQQVVGNILGNALKFTPRGGHVQLTLLAEGERARLEVTDDGPGIPAEVQSRIFNLYFTTKEHGSGIGLATTFRVVQLHSGTIDFVSEPGKGTTFRLLFPGVVDYESEALTSATSTS